MASSHLWENGIPTKISSFRRHTSYSSSNHHSSSCYPSADGCPHHHLHAVTPTGIDAPHPTLASLLTQTSHMPLHRLLPVLLQQLLPLLLYRKHSQEKPNYIQDLQTSHQAHYSKTVTIQDSPSDSSSDSDIDSDQFNLLGTSPSSDEDEQGRHSSDNNYTIGLVSDCPTVTVHAGKRFIGSD